MFYDENSPIEDLRSRIKDLLAQIDQKQIALDCGEYENEAGHKAAITRWQNEAKTLNGYVASQVRAEAEEARKLAQADHDAKLQAEITAIQNRPGSVVKPEIGLSSLRDSITLMSRDVFSQPQLNPNLDVSIFIRRMGMVYQSYCKDKPELETHFLRCVEQQLDPQYRHSFQQNTMSEPVQTWSAMEQYLLKTHKSNSTLFQEMAQFDSLHFAPNEHLRDFASRVKLTGGDVACVVKSKFRDMTGRDLTADDLFSIFESAAMIREMQGHPTYSKHYDSIVKDLDMDYRIEDVTRKASLFADRQVTPPATTVTSAQAFSASKPVEVSREYIDREIAKSMKSFAAKQQNKSQNSSKEGQNKEKSTFKRKSWKERAESDPEWAKKMSAIPCKNQRDYGCCKREFCPFNHSSVQNKGHFLNQISSQNFL